MGIKPEKECGMILLEKRFGTAAIDSGVITKEQLQEALSIQVEENVEGNTHKLIGNILMDLGHMSDDQANKIIMLLKRD